MLRDCSSVDDVVTGAQQDGIDWILLIKQQAYPLTNHKRKYKPLKIKKLSTNVDIDLDLDEFLTLYQQETGNKSLINDSLTLGDKADEFKRWDENSSAGSSQEGDIDDVVAGSTNNQKVIYVPNMATRSKKANKREKWVYEDAARNSSNMILHNLSNAPIITVDALRDETLEIISITSLAQKEEWLRKVLGQVITRLLEALPRAFIITSPKRLIKGIGGQYYTATKPENHLLSIYRGRPLKICVAL